jgi:NNP family nitrate/nitrite transporter-like MFS transporter
MDSGQIAAANAGPNRIACGDGPTPEAPAANTLQLVLGTGAFAACFAIFGSVSAMMPELRKPERLNLSPLEVSIALAVPVLLGSLGRIPLGILTDQFGGRIVFVGVLVFSIVPAVFMGWVGSFATLLVCGFFLGIALASFSVGAGFVSGWYAPARQGMALGVYGAGNVGQSLAAFGAPLMVLSLGFEWGFWIFALLAGLWLVFFLVTAADAPRRGPAKSWGDFIRPLAQTRSWVLSLYYFLTFGGFVAMAIYLPIFLTEAPFNLSPTDAGFRTAGFVLLATTMRPVGGILADKIGGQKILLGVFPATAAFALCMACPLMATFTVGALGMALAIGLGNGAVFKLVPESFPKTVGSVTGLVGAAGGLGGFFPPLVLGVIRQTLGSFTLGFFLLAMFSLACLLVCWKSEQKKAPLRLCDL